MRNYSGFHTVIHPSEGNFIGEFSEQYSVLSVGTEGRMQSVVRVANRCLTCFSECFCFFI